jgi:hypothetical protein
MRYGLLLGMAMVLSLSLPVMGAVVSGPADSVIIGNAMIAPGQNQIAIPVYFVTQGGITFYNLPLKVESSFDVQIIGVDVGEALKDWDDNWQGTVSLGRESNQLGFCDLGGDDNTALNTNGLRVEAFKILIQLGENANADNVQISPRVDDRNGAPLFGYAGGAQGVNPVVIGGSVSREIGGSGDTPSLPSVVTLAQNYPNPFNPTTEISYALPDAREVKLSIFNVLGQEIRNLAQGTQEAGYHKVIWDGKNAYGQSVPSGAYFYKLEAGDFAQSMKMILLK